MRKLVLIVLAGFALCGCTSTRITAKMRPATATANASPESATRVSKNFQNAAPEELGLRSEILVVHKQAIECTRTRFMTVRRYSTADDSIQIACNECKAQWSDGDKALDALVQKRAGAGARLAASPKSEQICLTQKPGLDRDYLKSTITGLGAPLPESNAEARRSVTPAKRGWDI
ncbi:MAG: hypothetical protein K2X62_10800 [Beijerinckiaceae bacterium]|jgi:hypothetical protein|nr:hypothetical protein [Beijerinckiaceae bacterium]MDO9440244.1 hypothetical protein [Beijerinckiaceae bacterium]